ncbi:MAG TPA: amino acid adenylation domain-containing protein [Bacillota bacterium]|nr:amino acid adenylation domain-containing protein [Bacillota bacterium]
MTKAIFFGYPAHGHTNPTLGLVQELVSRGEEVVYYSSEKFRQKIENTGARFRKYPEDILNDDPAAGTIDEGDEVLTYMANGIVGSGKVIIQRMMEEIQAEKPDYILHDSYAYWGKQIAALLEIPAVSSITVFAFSRKLVEIDPEMFMRNVIRISWERLEKKYKTKSPISMLDTLSGYIQNIYGLKDFDIMDIVTSREQLNIVYTSRALQVYAEYFNDSFKFVGPSIRPQELAIPFPFEKLSGKPLIYVSMGTIFNKTLDFYQKCLKAFCDSEVQVVMAIGEELEISSLGEIPANCIVMNYVPQLEILKRAAVFITHAGFNSTSEAIFYQVPLVMYPQSMDQFLVADRVDKLGAGIHIQNQGVSPAELKAITQKVLSDPSYREKCLAIAESFTKAGSYQKAADEIQAYVSRSVQESADRYSQNIILSSREFVKEKEYWLEKLQGEITISAFPPDSYQPSQVSAGAASLTTELNSETAAKLITISRNSDFGIYMILLAAVKYLLYRYTGNEDVIVGMPVFQNKVAEKTETPNNLLLLRTTVAENLTVRDLMSEVKNTVTEADEHSNFPFLKLAEILKLEVGKDTEPYLQIMVLMAPVHQLKQVSQVKVDTLFSFTREESRIRLEIIYNPSLYQSGTMERIATHFLKIIDAFTINPNALVAGIEMITKEEREQILFGFNNTQADYPKEKTIHQLFEAQVAQAPDRVATLFDKGQLTYGELNRKANHLAHLLRANGVQADQIIGIMVDRSPEMLIGILGILKAGAAYLPIDPGYPTERIEFQLADSQTEWLLTKDKYTRELHFSGKFLDLENIVLPQKDVANPENRTKPGHVAYVIYTSGSTGRPKGAMVEHYSVINRIHWMQMKYPIGEEDVILQKTTYTFDVSVWELFWWGMTGALVCLLKPGDEKDPGAILEAIQQYQVTTLHFVPSMFSAFLEFLETHPGDAYKLGSLRHLFTSGEALQPVQVERFNRITSHACVGHLPQLINLYGPTEATVDVSYYDCPLGEDPSHPLGIIPIGKPIDNIQLYVLDPHHHLQPVGVAGELYIAGDGLARGYLNRPELTVEKFVVRAFRETPLRRMYRTGDLTRWLPDGNIQFLGRIDHQVKIRGFRIELGEIEAAILKYASVKEVIVLSREDRDHRPYICAYFVADGRLTVSELRGYLTGMLPDYMIPSYFVPLEKIPMTSNHKVDRRALPEPVMDLKQVYESPRNETEAKLVEIWQEVLGLEQVGINTNFFTTGGDSIKAISLISKMNQALESNILVRDMYMNQTIKDLSEFIQENQGLDLGNERRQGLAIIDDIKRTILEDPTQAQYFPKDIEDFYPLSKIQQGMVFFTKLMPDEPIYHDQFPYQVKLRHLNIELLNKALKLLAERHSILRTTFNLERFSTPIQMVHSIQSGIIPALALEDLSSLSKEEQGKTVRAAMAADLKNRYQFNNDLLWRLQAFKLDPYNYCFVLSFQHAALDGWSVAVMMGELFEIFTKLEDGSPYELPSLKSSYKDHVAINLGRETAKPVRQFWQDTLKGYTRNKLPFNFSNKKVNQTNGRKILYRILSHDLLNALEEKARSYQCTLQDICLSAHVYLLGIITTETDIVTGVVSHDRPPLEDSEKVLGCFLNTIPMRIKVEPEMKKTVLLNEVKRILRDVKAHEMFLADIAEIIGENGVSGNPIFDSLHNFTNYHVLKSVETSWGAEMSDYSLPLESSEMTNTLFDLEVSKTLDVMFMQIKYSPNYFYDEDIQTASDLYIRLLEEFAFGANEDLRGERLLSKEEMKAIVYDFNQTQAEYPASKTLHQVFEEQVNRTPDQVALVFEDPTGEREMTYRELNEKANQLARMLLEKGVKSGDHVALITERGFSMIKAMLAVLKCGGAYVPIDPEYPLARQEYIASNSKVSAVLVDKDYPIQHENKILMDWDQLNLFSGENLQLKKDSRDLAYVIYTSGSTGVPKGVMIEHHSAVNLVLWVNREFQVNSQDTLLFITSMCFDLSVYDIFGTLAAGGRVVIARKEQVQNPAELTELLSKHRITFWDSVPSTMNYLVNTLADVGTDYVQEDLRLVFMSGDWIPVSLPERLARYFPNARTISLGGATEGTVWSIYYPIEKCVHARSEFQTSIPYGRPIVNNYFYILDQNRNVVPKGVAGELYIGGVGVARGYMNDEEKTSAAFVKNRFIDSPRSEAPPRCERERMMYRTGDLGRMLPDGNIEFLGRKDHQVKIRGYRVELGEIESKLLKHGAVKEAVVVDKTGADGNKYLCAYIVWHEEQTVATMREYLAGELPDYMIPTYYIAIERIPLTSNGKIDRKALPEPEGNIHTGVEYVAPRDPVEAGLAQIWQEILEVEKLGVNDNFFELGGHSLKATAMVSKIHRQFDIEIPLREAFTHQTVAEIAGLIKTKQQQANAFERLLSQIENMSDEEAGQLLKQEDVKATPEILVKFCAMGGHRARVEMLSDDKRHLLATYAKNQSIETIGSSYVSISPAPEQEYYPLSSAQKRLFILEQFERTGTSYNIPMVMLVEGNLDIQKFGGLFKKLVERHEAFRTSFKMVQGEPVQIIHPKVEFEVSYRELTEEKAKEAVAEFIKPFDLSKAPLLRVELIKRSKGKFLLLLDMHHIISDGTSAMILIKEFAALYDGKSLPELRIQYKDFSIWQNRLFQSEEFKKQQDYWLSEFAGSLPVLNLPTDFPRPSVQTFRGDRIAFSLDPQMTRQLNKLALDNQATLFMVLLAGYNILLAKYCGQEDIVVGSPIAGRPHADLENLAGMFVNSLALRNYPEGGKKFSRFLGEVREHSLKAYENQDYQFEELVEKLAVPRDLSRNAVFDIMFGLQKAENTVIKNADFKLLPYEFENKTAKFDLTLNGTETENGVDFTLEYATDLFTRETVLRLAEHFKNILGKILENPQIELQDIPMISEAEKGQILDNFNNTQTAFPKNKTIQSIFEEQAGKTPDKVALIFEEKQLTYGELNEKANRLARILRDNGARTNQGIGVLAERSLEMIIGIFGILKAGCAYVPLETNFPEERIRYMLDDCGSEVLLVQSQLLDKVDFKGKTIVLDDEILSEGDGSNLKEANCSSDLAYIMYTSGSTGKPKGNLITHFNITRVVKDTNYIDITAADVLLQLSNYAFDGSTFDIFGALLNGASLVLVGKDTVLNLVKLTNLIEEKGITIFFVTTALFNMLVDLKLSCFQKVRKVLFGGERVSLNHAEKAFAYMGKGRIIHVYGPTESTVYATYYPIDEINQKMGTVPIGKPLANTQVYIVDKNNNLQPVGVPGELCIAGDGLARGYMNNPELTEQKFVVETFHESPPQEGHSLQHPRIYRTGDLARWLPDGNIEFLGRIDHQVKLRGYRIEMGEIEAQLLKHEAIQETIVVVKEDGSGKNLCAYFVSERELTIPELREYLAKDLPDYMIPAYFIRLEKMPLTPNGKIDQKALPEPSGIIDTGVAYVAPGTEAEAKLADIWQEVLQVEKVGIHDEFFVLGGDSLKALKVADEAANRNIQISITDIFKHKTIAKILENMEEHSMETSKISGVSEAAASKIKEQSETAIKEQSETEIKEQSETPKRSNVVQTRDRWPVFRVYEIDTPEAKELKVEIQRDITIYNHRAIPLCVILTDPNLHPWYFERFLNIFSTLDHEGFLTLDYLEVWAPYREIINEISLGTEMLEREPDIINFAIDNINRGYYPSIAVDEYYCPGKQKYQKVHYIHHALVYGYDNNERILKTVGYDVAGILTGINFTYDVFTEAYELGKLYYQEAAPWASRTAAQLFFSNGFNAPYPFDANKVIQGIHNYLFSTSEEATTYFWNLKRERVTYGFDVYDVVIHHFKNFLEGKFTTDYRAIHLLAEHKKVIAQRLEYINARYPMDGRFLELYGAYLKIADQFNDLRLKFFDLQFGLTDDQINNSMEKLGIGVMQIIEMLYMTKEKERVILTEIYEILKAKFAGN